MIRAATAADAKAIDEIYGYYAENTVVTFSEKAPTEGEYAEKIARISALYPFLVLEESGGLLGFCYADRLRPHDAYLWDAELTIYLAPDAPKRRGYGKRLLSALLNTLAYQGFLGAYSVVTYPNAPSVRLHQALGFRQVGYFERAGFKKGRWLDVVWLYKPLGAFPENPKAPRPFPALSKSELDRLLA